MLRGWHDARCWREVLIRGGLTAVMAAIVYFALLHDPVIWVAPLLVSALVLLRWGVRPEDRDE